jgi:hypothetical protein
MNPLLVEDLLLITAHPTRGTVRRPTGLALPRALAGAAVNDLLVLEAARLDGNRLILAAPPRTPHPLLRHAWARLATRESTVDQAIDTLAAPRTRLGQHLLQALTASGATQGRDRRLPGLLPMTSHQVIDANAVQALRSRVGTALRGPVSDARATALAGVVSAADLHRTVHLHTGTAGSRHDQLLVHDPVAAAVARTIRRARRDAATTGAIAATAGAVAASGS